MVRLHQKAVSVVLRDRFAYKLSKPVSGSIHKRTIPAPTQRQRLRKNLRLFIQVESRATAAG